MKKIIFTAVLTFLSFSLFSQETAFTAEELDLNQFIRGTLTVPTSPEAMPLVIMLQGSGPTDRHGNQAFLKNDSFKKLARELALQGIASYRFDKRILQASKLGVQEEDMRFDDFVEDASTVLNYFQNQQKFSKIIVLGHSQGSLVGMLAAKEKADAFISIAGVAQPIDSVITKQVAGQMPALEENVRQTFKELREKGSSTTYNPVLESLFRPSVQPFILSWMQFDPQKEIAHLNMPVLLINGTKDLQVEPSEAEALQKAYPASKLIILEKMNHVLREIEGDNLVNSKSYNEPGLALHPELVPVISSFIKSL